MTKRKDNSAILPINNGIPIPVVEIAAGNDTSPNGTDVEGILCRVGDIIPGQGLGKWVLKLSKPSRSMSARLVGNKKLAHNQIIITANTHIITPPNSRLKRTAHTSAVVRAGSIRRPARHMTEVLDAIQDGKIVGIAVVVALGVTPALA